MKDGMNKKASTDIYEGRPCKVYNCNTRTLISSHESLMDCAKEYGLDVSYVHRIISLKVRNKTNNKGLTITIR